MWRLVGPTYPHLMEAYKNGEIGIAYDPRPPDRAPGWRAREKEREKQKQKDMEESEKIFAEKKERKRRDDLERKLRDQREREGRSLSLIVPTHGGGEGLRAPRADGGMIPVQEERTIAQQGWAPSTRPEFRAELDATPSNQQATRLYELEADSAPQQFNPSTQSRQTPLQQSQPRRTSQRFELMGDFPGQHSHPPRSAPGYHPAPSQQRHGGIASVQPQGQTGHNTPYQTQPVTEAQMTCGRRPIHYPPGFFENPRTPPDIFKYNRLPLDLHRW